MPLPTGGVEVRVWAPEHERVEVLGQELEPAGDGVFEAVLDAQPGDRYLVNGEPDPFSRCQPEGILGPSQVVDTSRFEIADGPALTVGQLVIYELHVGTFTRDGTFDAVVPELPRLRALGVTAIELMPVATFPGNRGWGYDGIYSFAPHPAYGGPEGLARLVDAAHREGLGVFLDVVYNHLGPGAGPLFAPWLTDEYETFWGPAIDYAQPVVREWALQNAELWTRDYKIDGLRLDAVHSIFDDSPVHILREVRDRVDALVVSEMGHTDFRPLDEWGHDAMWLDNLHHELHVVLTGEHDGYYAAFGSMEGLVRELTRERPERLVVAAQNHDQVGNRALGDRLPPDAHRVALAIVLFSASTPLLFMGDEHGERAPFQFFTDHVDPFIADRTREGRKREFAAFESFGGHVPDPQDVATFERSRISQPAFDPFYAELIALRRGPLEVAADGCVLTLRRGGRTLVADLDAKTVQLV